jgi:hypothetical protein
MGLLAFIISLLNHGLTSILNVLALWTVGILLIVAAYREHRIILIPALVLMVGSETFF